ncbi:hypothetical protein FC40_GL001179 [Ligilactobacillus hayakitensis DSM 18933 = JCM 14209]|uniref:Lipoprotein n=1 Tax=Ligilactobacillus hayakitensis DSM 18933 = JCM 14209 TaxID=1423755 RepID=A0A0R1WI37_9LACO|nr:hypothetical protein [Ligilactobacillus hayakitensis]KRM17407.1 hypothetical protein FC40_GL001179 [Ligilactobacillus hayakitensis DSM 18933 = JCM 14209]
MKKLSTLSMLLLATFTLAACQNNASQENSSSQSSTSSQLSKAKIKAEANDKKVKEKKASDEDSKDTEDKDKKSSQDSATSNESTESTDVNSDDSNSSSSSKKSVNVSKSDAASLVWNQFEATSLNNYPSNYDRSDFSVSVDDKNSDGSYTVTVRENHDGPHAKANGADPDVAPMAGMYSVDANGNVTRTF